MATRAAKMIRCGRGEFQLSSFAGNWSYEAADSDTQGHLVDENGISIGTFTYAPIDETDVFEGLFSWDTELSPWRPLKSIGVTSSEVMKHIQLPESEGSYFVLPSQLNGAEYPSNRSIVKQITDYRMDNTGGPRGQLAVHPGAGQFVLDNAASKSNPEGINAIDAILEAVPEVELLNGYLTLPTVTHQESVKAGQIFNNFCRFLHTLRPLIMHEVTANGLTPDKRSLSDASHRVGLVYASAVPVDTYQNRASNLVERKLHWKIAEAVLVAQYYGALRAVAQRVEAGLCKKPTTVYFMPLGGGVFGNSFESIARAMAQAAELLAIKEPSLFDLVEVQALAWSGRPSETVDLVRELTLHHKYYDGRSERQRAAEVAADATTPEAAEAMRD